MPRDDGALSAKTIQDLINHIVLPPKLPQSEDTDPIGIRRDLLRLLQDVVKTFDHCTDAAWISVSKMLSTLGQIEQGKHLQNDSLSAQFKALGIGDCLALNLPLHNSALLFLCQDSETIVIEAFEVSATNESVLSAQGRLTRTFPGCAVACSCDKFFDVSFQSELCIALRRLMSEGPPESYQPQTIRLANVLHETRDTIHPGFVNDYLMTILSVVGKDYSSIRSQKNTRDDVLWKNTELCWRREPFWLFCKVAILRTLLTTLPAPEAREQYKSFMLDVVAYLLQRSCEMSIDPQVRSSVHAKLARRALKFEQSAGKKPSDNILAISSKARAALEHVWTQHAEKVESIATIALEGWEHATSLALPEVRKKLAQKSAPLSAARRSLELQMKSPLRYSQKPSILPSGIAQSSGLTDLIDIETWVDHNLCDWTNLMLTKETTEHCERLHELVEKYWTRASSAYQSNPLEMSCALLVVLELWVALDKICTSQIPLMLEYPPEIPVNVFQPIPLPTARQMQRLFAVESHINERWSRASIREQSAFANPTENSFCVRYYDVSSPLQNLYKQIKKSDADAKAIKDRELAIVMNTWKRLKTEHGKMECDDVYDLHGDHKDLLCAKHQREQRIKTMTFTLIDESLPTKAVQSKAAIFELKIPTQFAAWRDATWLIVNDIGQREAVKGEKMHITVRKYHQLKGHLSCKPTRITLGSCKKAMAGPGRAAHYRIKTLPVKPGETSVTNCHEYKLWDQRKKCWVLWPGVAPNFKSFCTLSVPSGPYENLDWTIRTTQHTCNEIISQQHERNNHLEKTEYLSFGTLRAGERVQWINILRELGCTYLDFAQPAVVTLVLQAAWEAGSPSNDVLRTAHAEFSNPAFCSRLLLLLHRRLIAIESSWDKQYSMMVVIQLGLRLLSLTSIVEIELGCLELLHRARRAALGWCRQIEAHIHDLQNKEQTQAESGSRLLLAALLCYSTFDVEDRHIAPVLDSAEDLACAVEAQSMVHDNAPPDTKSVALLIRQSLVRHTKIAHKIEPRVKSILHEHGLGLVSAVQKIWHGACFELWTVASDDADSWVQNKTISARSGPSQQVHYNLLDGELLVDGKPVRKVPDNIKSDPLFLQLFGSSVLRVFASDIPGMDCRLSKHIDGNEIHFGIWNSEVVVKARFDGEIFQAVPQKTFAEALPNYFVQSFHHWANERTGEVEFRPLHRPWQPSGSNWRMHFSNLKYDSARAVLRQGSRYLVDIHSPVGKSITSVFSSLDRPSYCHIFLDKSNCSELGVVLPRYNLHFTISAVGEIRSLEFNAVLDDNQAIETMIGLQNKLVLRTTPPIGCPQERQILVPFGAITVNKDGHHVAVNVQDGAAPKRRYFVYKLNRHLRKLRGAQDLLGHLYQAYLHATTSFCLPDPFTRTTGTEEALSILESAYTFTSTVLQEDEKILLQKISALTPMREYYPLGRKVMQTVTWDPNLPVLSQHDDFVLAAQAIAEHHRKCEQVCGQQKNMPFQINRGESHLLERARKRNSALVRSGLVSPITLSAHDDLVYQGRDRPWPSLRSQRAYEIAMMVKEWPSNTYVHEDFESIIKGWEKISGYQTKFDHTKFLMYELITLQLPKHWGSLYEMCRTAARESMTYPLMFAFAAITFGSQPDILALLQTLLAFVVSPFFDYEDPPTNDDTYDLSFGFEANLDSIRRTVSKHRIRPVLPSKPSQAQSRGYADEVDLVEKQTKWVAREIFDQWPAVSIMPLQRTCSHVPIALCLTECQLLFNRWHKNGQFLTHISYVNSMLKLTDRAPKRISSRPSVKFGIDTPTSVQFSIPGLKSLLLQSDRVRETTNHGSISLSWSQKSGDMERSDVTALDELVQILLSREGDTHKQYASVLLSSLEVFRRLQDPCTHQQPRFSIENFKRHYFELAQSVEARFMRIHQRLSPSSSTESILADADLWPRIAESTLLSYLSSTEGFKSDNPWYTELLSFAECIASLQRAERMLKLAKLQEYRTLSKELETPGREGWSPMENPSWLLLEIENNITIRPLQAKVAKQMINPSSGANSVMQLNMGEGKSSVIIPMLATALADGNRLVRIVVLKPLLQQTEQVLLQRLGGLLGHRIFHIPFSRRTRVDHDTISGMSSIMADHRSNRGVMIALPEEVLSMELMTREKMISDKMLAAAVLDLQRFLKNTCRDVIDESDEILSVKPQLIYPVGSQQMLDGKSNRWLVAQSVLRRVKQHVIDLSEQFPSQLNADLGSKSFPVITFLDPAVFNRLLDLLVADALEGRLSDLLTTGFSGTNDSRVTLPYSIEQKDLDELEHTNAMVLNLLLRPENQKYIHGSGACGKRLSITELLTLISQQQPVINVLIDVGAQVLEATNIELVRQWLKYRPDAKAAVYFDSQDEPVVLDRNGVAIPLRISPLFGKLNSCLIYMDEMHTRGIDLAIPVGAHAAVTLGPRLVKDRLTQACMRLRQLGEGQSLCFIAPTEVHRSICDMKGCEYDTALTSFDVLAWSINESCRALETAKPLRTMQGLEYLRQQKVINQHLPSKSPSTSVTANKAGTKRFWSEIQENESRSLELLYGVHAEHISVAERWLDRGSSNLMMQHLICQFDSTEKATVEDCNIDNEQEREIAHEIEREVGVELSPPAFPCQHAISEGICRYIETGKSSDLEECGVMRAFAALRDTSAARTLKRQNIDPAVFDLWVSHDFWLAVDLPQSSPRDHYMPPVNWVLRSTKNNSLLIVSPFEANELLPQIKKSRKTALHTFAPRVNKAMVSFSDLSFYTLTSNSSVRPFSAGAVRALNLFAGSLYLGSKSKYEALRGTLGLVSQQSITQDINVQSDGFVDPEDRRKIRSLRSCPFSKSPVPFLKEVIMLRRNGQEFDHTHMGHLLGGKELTSSAFDGLDAGEVRKAQDEVEEEGRSNRVAR
ncbi:hypothetical protein KCU71_g3382, partial [Aureobasidium melanogenum]